MKVKDVLVHIELYGGHFTGLVWNGRVGSGCALSEIEYYPIHGRDDFLHQINTQNFIKIGDKLHNVKEIKSVSFREETERDIP